MENFINLKVNHYTQTKSVQGYEYKDRSIFVEVIIVLLEKKKHIKFYVFSLLYSRI